MPRLIAQLLVVMALLGVLSGCESSEERAERHFQRGVALYEAGDAVRAVVELRNVFKLDGAHLDARMLMARIEEDRDNSASAYRQYLIVTENHPANYQAQRAAASLAGEIGDWEAAERHVEAAKLLSTEAAADPELRAVELGVAYQRARRTQDTEAARNISGQAEELLASEPDQMLARKILIDARILRRDWEAALMELDAALARSPEERLFYELRLSVLEVLDRPEAVETQLRSMVDLFPGDENLHRTLARWYVSQNRMDDAENYLRNRSTTGDREADARLMLIDFLFQLRGPEATLSEIDRILATTDADDVNRPLYLAAKAGLIFDSGDQETAIAQMERILQDAAPSDQIQRIRLGLAKMLEQTANPVGARALVEQVLEEDVTNVQALKMRAAWLIETDRPDAALVELRRALDEAPRDAELFTLAARAQERAGSRDLMGEMLAIAVEVSNGAPEESLRYATFLSQDDRLLAAESVLTGALRLRPGHLQILNMLGNIYVRLENWSRAQAVIDSLEGDGGTLAATMADGLRVRMLTAQDRRQELRSLLEQLAATPDGNGQAVMAAIRLHLASGDLQGALDFLDKSLEDAPDNFELRFISARLLALQGNYEEADAALRSLLNEEPQFDRLWLALYNLRRGMDKRDEAEKILMEGLEAIPDSAILGWALAGELEQRGDVESAIAIYERLYAQNSDSAVIANNLASLISSFSGDDESLQRASAIAQRLRGTEVPQFQDTYGWIAARLGNHDEALEYLEPAAAALPKDPIVRYHLARTYDFAGRREEALASYRTARDLMETSGWQLPIHEQIAGEIANLEAEQAVPTE